MLTFDNLKGAGWTGCFFLAPDNDAAARIGDQYAWLAMQNGFLIGVRRRILLTHGGVIECRVTGLL